MMERKGNTKEFRGIHILALDRKEVGTRSVNDGTIELLLPVYLEKKLFQITARMPARKWTAVYCNSKELENGFALEFFQDTVLEMFESNTGIDPLEIFFLIVEDESVDVFEKTVQLAINIKGSEIPVFSQGSEKLAMMKREAHSNDLNVRHSCYCVALSYLLHDCENATYTDDETEVRSIKLLYMNSREAKLSDFITENGFRI